MTDEKKPATLSVKLDRAVIEAARVVAALRGVTMTALLSDLLRADVARLEDEEIAKRARAKPPKGGGAKS
jgi:hypothetical protein